MIEALRPIFQQAVCPNPAPRAFAKIRARVSDFYTTVDYVHEYTEWINQIVHVDHTIIDNPAGYLLQKIFEHTRRTIAIVLDQGEV